jgi:hypothetical protein
MKEELRLILKELSEVIEEEKLNITHSEIFDAALRIYLTQTINKNKTTPLKNELEPKEDDGLATPNQIYALKKAGKEIPKGLTRKEAWKILKELKR